MAAADTDTYVTEVAFGDAVITTTVTSSGAAVEGWLRENPVGLLQLCVDRRCLIFQLLYADYVPGSLRRFLAGAADCFVGVGVDKDAERLSDDHGLTVANTADLRPLAAQRLGRPELSQAGLQAVVRAVMGADLVKPQRVTMSRWDASCLSNEQIRYACIDAYVSFEVGRRLLRA
ncbi:hypothetical protein OsJ_02898 [Oryza sativa Japonica Group]|uniref:3'-5' exonuclease domain-containing protein n=1 Tax=Oryza sativa subsp. japonica TaxID=39947 RepID=B9EYF7_ORYSJ|nr:hypothetical protein OsJ_02898 [Oryza sativa Japonica Group]